MVLRVVDFIVLYIYFVANNNKTRANMINSIIVVILYYFNTINIDIKININIKKSIIDINHIYQ